MSDPVVVSVTVPNLPVITDVTVPDLPVVTDVGIGGIQGPVGPGVPQGGAANELLAKVSGTDFDTEWVATLEGIDAVYFDTEAGVTVDAEGELAWDTDAGTIDLGLEGGVVHKVGEDLFYRVQAASNISKGQVVMAVGTLGNSGLIVAAPATPTYNGNPVDSQRLMGLAATNITSGSRGYVIAAGQVRKVNTNAYTEGQILYADPTVPGGLTATLPQAPNWKTVIALVVTRSAQVGVLQVRPTFGSSLGNDELVQLSNLQQGDTLLWDAAQGRFENGQPPTALVDSVNGQVGDVVLGIGDLDNVTLGALNEGDGLFWDGSAFVNQPASTGSEVRDDFVTPYSYIGVAPKDSSESAAVWLISRINVGPPVVTQTAANVPWTGRGTAVYS